MESKTINRHLEHRLLEEFPGLLAFLRRLSPAEAEDLAQETVARVLKYQSSFDPKRSLRNWLFKTAFRVYLDQKKQRDKHPVSLGLQAEELHGKAECDAGDRDLVDRLLSRLTVLEKEIVLRFHSRGENIADIAQALELPTGTVKSHLHRARRRMTNRREASNE